MSNNEFKPGRLAYRVHAGISCEQLAASLGGQWDDGYLAFAQTERRWEKMPARRMDAEFLASRVTDLAGVEGYVTEINLWRKQGERHEEIAAERIENTWHVQHWTLDTNPETGAKNCWHRPASTRAGSHHRKERQIFSGSLPTIEVVWPQHRLNFYLGVKRG